MPSFCIPVSEHITADLVQQGSNRLNRVLPSEAATLIRSMHCTNLAPVQVNQAGVSTGNDR
jgi:hypothetical protein